MTRTQWIVATMSRAVAIDAVGEVSASKYILRRVEEQADVLVERGYLEGEEAEPKDVIIHTENVTINVETPQLKVDTP